MDAGKKSHSYLRDRVHAFEGEMEKAIASLTDVEKEIVDMNRMRSGWLKSVAGADEIDLESYEKTLEAFKKQAEIIQISVEEDAIRLDAVYEKQQLQMLVEATKPLEDDETDKVREKRLAALAMEGTVEMKAALEVSVAERRRLCDESADLTRACEMAKGNYQNKGIMRGDEIKKRIQGYIRRLTESVEEGKARVRSTTRDYLVLRHNAKVAAEILQRSENDAHRHREELQRSLEAVVSETAVHMERMEHGCREEVKKLTGSVRENVIRRERELEDLRQRTYAREIENKETNRKYRRLVKEYGGMYDDLQDKRRKDIRAITDVLRDLKSGLGRAELMLVGEGTKTRTGVSDGAVAAASGGLFGGSGSSARQATQARALLSMLAAAPVDPSVPSERDENVFNMPPPPPTARAGGLAPGMETLEGLTAIQRMSAAGILLSHDERDLLMLAARMKQLSSLSQGI